MPQLQEQSWGIFFWNLESHPSARGPVCCPRLVRRIHRQTHLGSAPTKSLYFETPQPDELRRILHAAAVQADIRKSGVPRIVLVVQTPKGETEMSKQANGIVRQNATKTREMAAQLVADDRLTDREIAEQCGIDKATLERWKLQMSFKTRVQAIVAEYAKRETWHCSEREAARSVE